MDKKQSYSVAVLGFNQTEKVVLGSIFGLSARRAPKFEAATREDRESPDIFLVDADDPAAIEEFRKYNAGRNHPAILIGSNDHGLAWPVLSRPLQWTRLFKAFDLAIDGTVPAVAAAANAQTQVAATASAPAQVATMAGAPAQVAAHGASGTMRVPSIAATAHADTGTARVPHLRVVGATPPAASVLPAMAQAAPLAEAAEAAPDPALDWALVVDDNATVREFMRTRLAPFKINVDYAESGEEAIGLTAKRHYSCVFLDVVMPGMDGYQVCKLIRARKHVRKTAVVMLTSKGSPFDRIRGTMAGCDTYLTKPVNEDRLLETIAKYLPQG